MYISEIWRYPVKSMAGEKVQAAKISELGVLRDREVVVVRGSGIATARRYPKLLGLRGGLDSEGVTTVNGHRWDSKAAKELVEAAVDRSASLIQVLGAERFDILPLLVATDGAIQSLGVDGRRLRPNIVVGGVTGLDERSWPGKRIKVGPVVIMAAQLRERCVMTTYDPDTQAHDPGVLKRIRTCFGGTMALDCAVLSPGEIAVGASVSVI